MDGGRAVLLSGDPGLGVPPDGQVAGVVSHVPIAFGPCQRGSDAVSPLQLRLLI